VTRSARLIARPALFHFAALHWLAVWLVLAASARTALGQVFPRSLALPPADVDQLEATSLAHLESAKRFFAEQQWDEGVVAIRRVQETDSSRLVGVPLDLPTAGFERFIPADDYCQARLAQLAVEAPEALDHFRNLVDPLAEEWLREGIARRDPRPLERILRQAFASRSGDAALWTLGELALERGNPAAARAAWERVLPGSPSASPPRFSHFPDSKIPVADVESRLVLASILEGSRSRAQHELAALGAKHPEAAGTLGGRSGKFAELLATLLADAETWPPPQQSPDWPLLAGNPTRNGHAAENIDPAGQPLWTFPLPQLASDRELIGAGRWRVADEGKGVLAYHPVVSGQTVLVACDARQSSYVFALDLASGREAWRVEYPRTSRRTPVAEAEPADAPLEVNDAHADLVRHLGVARYTPAVHEGNVFLRLGSQIVGPATRRRELWLAKDQGFLQGFNLRTQGKPLEGFPIRPEGPEWTFAGGPLAAGSDLFVVMRKSEAARSQLYVAAFERQTTAANVNDDEDESRPTGRLKWRTRIASFASLGGGQIDELANVLLASRDGKLYLNSCAGVIASVDATDGRLDWLVRYPRATLATGNPDTREEHFFRDLVPCLVWKDLVICAPADCERIFALNAATGQLVWTLPPGVAADAVHLLGVGGQTLLASGDRLYWIDAATGRLLCQFPAGAPTAAGLAAPSPRGHGRGILADGRVYFPARDSILVFDEQPAADALGPQPRLIRELRLSPQGLTGGNLVISQGILLIAAGDKLVAFRQ
jgi:outer membrane protein assembly factor BamB